MKTPPLIVFATLAPGVCARVQLIIIHQALPAPHETDHHTTPDALDVMRIGRIMASNLALAVPPFELTAPNGAAAFLPPSRSAADQTAERAQKLPHVSPQPLCPCPQCRLWDHNPIPPTNRPWPDMGPGSLSPCNLAVMALIISIVHGLIHLFAVVLKTR